MGKQVATNNHGQKFPDHGLNEVSLCSSESRVAANIYIDIATCVWCYQKNFLTTCGLI